MTNLQEVLVHLENHDLKGLQSLVKNFNLFERTQQDGLSTTTYTQMIECLKDSTLTQLFTEKHYNHCSTFYKEAYQNKKFKTCLHLVRLNPRINVEDVPPFSNIRNYSIYLDDPTPQFREIADFYDELATITGKSTLKQKIEFCIDFADVESLKTLDLGDVQHIEELLPIYTAYTGPVLNQLARPEIFPYLESYFSSEFISRKKDNISKEFTSVLYDCLKQNIITEKLNFFLARGATNYWTLELKGTDNNNLHYMLKHAARLLCYIYQYTDDITIKHAERCFKINHSTMQELLETATHITNITPIEEQNTFHHKASWKKKNMVDRAQIYFILSTITNQHTLVRTHLDKFYLERDVIPSKPATSFKV